MAKFKKCKCNELIRDDERHFLLTDHHPECPLFNPASELRGLEMQCRHFMDVINRLRGKIKDMEKIVQSIDSK